MDGPSKRDGIAGPVPPRHRPASARQCRPGRRFQWNEFHSGWHGHGGWDGFGWGLSPGFDAPYYGGYYGGPYETYGGDCVMCRR